MPDTASQASTRFWGSLERRIHLEWLALVFALLALTTALSYWGTALGLTRLDHVFYDNVLTASSYSVDDTDIVIIAIDDGSIDQLGYWPWRRSTHARLLDALGQAHVVGLDIVLSDANPAYPKDDGLLAQAIRRHGKVVLPLIVQNDGRSIVKPIAELAGAAAALGYINIQADSDGITRALTLHRRLASGERLNHFISAMLSVAEPERPAIASGPLPDQKALLIPYAGAPGHFTIYSYAAVLNGQVPAATFKNKYVLVGSWGSGLGDAFPTPVSRQGEAMSGVEILANGMLGALHDSWVQTPQHWQTALLSCLPVLLICLALRRLSPRKSFLATMVVLMGIFISSWLLMRYGRVWVPITASAIGVALALPVWSWRSQEASLQHIDQELLALNAGKPYSMMQTTAALDGSLPARVTQLHGAIAQLRHAHQKRDETLRFLSHDMRAPQNSILALTQLQQQTQTALPQKEFLQRIDSYADRTLSLVDGFVQLARAEAAPLAHQRLDLVELMAQCCDEFWAQAKQRDIDIHFKQHPDTAWLVGDPSLLGRACCNLLDNALKYSPSHTEITCRLEQDGDSWLLAIQDQGRGISPELQATLFMPFSRIVDTAADNPVGTGLGLAFVAAVAQRHEGSITVASTEGAGSTFKLRLRATA